MLAKQLRQIKRKISRQIGKDYVFFPLLTAATGPANVVPTITANVTANLTRNVWSYMIIFCGHFPDGALHFTEEELEDETRAEWYLRQMLGSANFEGGRLLHVMSGQLGYQIEHHLFPDLPSNRYAEIVGAGPRARREVRHPLHDRPAAPAVRPGAAHDHQAVAAQPLHLLRPARAADPVDRPRPPDRRRAAAPQLADRRLVLPELVGARREGGPARRLHPAARADPGVGDPVRAVADLRVLRGRLARPSPSSVRRARATATSSTSRRCTSRAPRRCGRRTRWS